MKARKGVEILNQMAMELENSLTIEPDYRKMAARLGMSEFVMQRVFAVMTGMSMSEYLRRRRLSAAYAELKTSEMKIIDIAMKYGWQSPTAFARAFKKEFGCTPSACRMNEGAKFCLFPALDFRDERGAQGLIEYHIENLGGFTIYGYEVVAKTMKKLSVAINEFYDELRADGRYARLDELGRYAITYEQDGQQYYLVGAKSPLPDARKSYKVAADVYAMFEIKSKKQAEIERAIDFAERVWGKSTGRRVAEAPILEKYSSDNCWIYVPLN